MATADDCYPQLGVCSVRVGALDADGTTGLSSVTTDATLKVTIKPNHEAGDEVKEKNGCGAIYVDFKGEDSLLWYDVEFEFLTPDPYLMSLLLEQSSLITASASRIGWAAPRIGAQTGNGRSVEFWTKRAKGGAQSLTFPYAHHALPLVQNMKLGDRTFDSGAQHAIITGQAVENSNWFDGPGNDWPSDDGGGGYLPNAWKWIPATTQPAAACGPAVVAAS